MAKDLNRYFIKKDVWMANKPMKMCPASLVTSKMQTKAPVRHHCTSIKMTKKKIFFLN